MVGNQAFLAKPMLKARRPAPGPNSAHKHTHTHRDTRIFPNSQNLNTRNTDRRSRNTPIPQIPQNPRRAKSAEVLGRLALHSGLHAVLEVAAAGVSGFGKLWGLRVQPQRICEICMFQGSNLKDLLCVRLLF